VTTGSGRPEPGSIATHGEPGFGAEYEVELRAGEVDPFAEER
jgi:hypothetical protein